MEVKKIIPRYDDAIQPLCRREIANILLQIGDKKDEMTSVEQNLLEDFYVEFRYDMTQSLGGAQLLFRPSGRALGSAIGELFTEKEKFLFAYVDTNVSLFVDGLLTLDARGNSGSESDRQNAGFVQFGGRMRGSIDKKLGHYIQATNAQFWGSRNTLRRDKIISQSYELGNMGKQNFDFIDGYLRYDAGIGSIQIGRERVLWGNGYSDKLILSDNPPVFDFIRADAQYKSLKYTFLHAWLLGNTSALTFSLPSDTSSKFTEDVVTDKYFAGHRLGVSFSTFVDVGFQELVIYSNRSPDLAYLNPITLIESAQRARQQRDNVLWAVDVQTHFLPNVELQGTIFFDDINFPRWGTNDVQNKYAYQMGAMVVDPFLFRNATIAVEYTRIEPFTFSHASRDNDYGSLGRILGHHIGPNADSWFFSLNYLFSHKLSFSINYEREKKGQNSYDPSGKLIRNVGGDFLEPHRAADPQEKEFLAGDLVETYRVKAMVTYEIVNEIFLDLRYAQEQHTTVNAKRTIREHDYGAALRFDF